METLEIDPAPETSTPPSRLRLVEYTDPYSIWCWGCEPALRRFEVLYPETLDIEVRMGGLFEDFTPMREWWVRMSGGRWKESVIAFMTGVADQHRMPMDPEGMLASIDDFQSTWPACIAVKAAELQGVDTGRRYLRRLREAALVAGRAIHRDGVRKEVAAEVGLDAARFARALEDGSAERAFHQDLDVCRSREVTGFPTFDLQGGEVSVRIEGWQPWEVFDETIRKLAPALRVRRIEPEEDTVLGLLRRNPRWATREVAAVFGLTDDEAELVLEELEALGKVRRAEAGTGLFWELPKLRSAAPAVERPPRARE